MESPTFSIEYTGVVPPVCDAEAGERWRGAATVYPLDHSSNASSADESPGNGVGDQTDPLVRHGFSIRKIRTVMAELCAAIRSALDDERGIAEDSLRRAAELLQGMGQAESVVKQEVRGGLCPWQIRKVTSHVEAHLDQTIRNEDLATIVRLNPSHFGRAFRNSFGEPPHEYVIRRRVERAQGLMLKTDASLSEIALDCGLSDQAHLSRLFRRIVGETPRAWRRARIGAPSECA